MLKQFIIIFTLSALGSNAALAADCGQNMPTWMKSAICNQGDSTDNDRGDTIGDTDTGTDTESSDSNTDTGTDTVH